MWLAYRWFYMKYCQALNYMYRISQGFPVVAHPRLRQYLKQNNCKKATVYNISRSTISGIAWWPLYIMLRHLKSYRWTPRAICVCDTSLLTVCTAGGAAGVWSPNRNPGKYWLDLWEPGEGEAGDIIIGAINSGYEGLLANDYVYNILSGNYYSGPTIDPGYLSARSLSLRQYTA